MTTGKEIAEKILSYSRIHYTELSEIVLNPRVHIKVGDVLDETWVFEAPYGIKISTWEVIPEDQVLLMGGGRVIGFINL